MLRINRQTDYAVRVVLALAQRGEGVRVSSAELQREMLIPKTFMGRIVAQLAQASLILTFPGRDGGLQISRDPQTITLKDVVEAFEGPILISECIISQGEEKDCPFMQQSCPVSSKWGRIQAAMLREMKSILFSDMVKESRNVQAASELLSSTTG
jgi:Rrf2 family transcriptional regulator, iron-sulfur cluster assembly transcription factor